MYLKKKKTSINLYGAYNSGVLFCEKKRQRRAITHYPITDTYTVSYHPYDLMKSNSAGLKAGNNFEIQSR